MRLTNLAAPPIGDSDREQPRNERLPLWESLKGGLAGPRAGLTVGAWLPRTSCPPWPEAGLPSPWVLKRFSGPRKQFFPGRKNKRQGGGSGGPMQHRLVNSTFLAPKGLTQMNFEHLSQRDRGSGGQFKLPLDAHPGHLHVCTTYTRKCTHVTHALIGGSQGSQGSQGGFGKCLGPGPWEGGRGER